MATGTNRADGALAAVDMMAGMAPEFSSLDGEALAECRRVLAMHGYRLETLPRLRAVRGRDEEGRVQS